MKFSAILSACLLASASAFAPSGVAAPRSPVALNMAAANQPVVSKRKRALKSLTKVAGALGTVSMVTAGMPATAIAANAQATQSAALSCECIKAVGTTFYTYCIADFLSNFIQHPFQKMDYGMFNKIIGRKVGSKFWGTRTEHIVGVAAALAVTDHASSAIFEKFLGTAISFAETPAAFVAHTFFFIFTGVVIFAAWDAIFNPANKGSRMATFKEEVYNTYVGTNSAWFEPFVFPTLVKLFGAAIKPNWFFGSLVPATLAYATVKGTGWNDWGNSGLNDLEKEMNGLPL
ncbi:hypothetical protein CTEN210_00268 [Chaetoceros tenuissimus]|uniref:Uncharacterized protein n=1 Tax=Chaetoceros tenuissimus TaxID=426638 RepID=A0AAD3CEU9_9STRA|nr:hypothetical protein CTEN210_00268 [Chaetoceros tenuissimus]